MNAWFCRVRDGEVVAPAFLADGSRFMLQLGGGMMTASLRLAKYARRDGSPDPAVIEKLLDYVTGGQYTLLLTEGTDVVGEWLIWTHHRRSDSPDVQFTGIPWESYPKYRSVFNTTNEKDTDAGEVHAMALHRAYNLFQPDDAVLVTVKVPRFGHKVTVKYPIRTAYYSEIVDDMDQLALAEWQVVPSVTWRDGAPVKVSRRVVYAMPRFQSAQPDLLVQPGVDQRGGNVTDVTRHNDYSRVTRAVIGWGAGEGGKQRFVEELQSGWTQAGFISITRNVNFPGELSDSQLSAKARGELAASQTYWDPTTLTIDTRRISRLPVLGGTHQLEVGPSWAFPSGWSARVRIGSITYTTGSDFVALEVEEI